MEQSTEYQMLVQRAVDSGKLELLQLWFHASVLDRYRGDPDARIVRSNSAGRLRGPGSWLLNFGIAPDEQLVHAAVSGLASLPEAERAHWLAHLVHPPAGANFLRMTLNPVACIDDGESRDW